jgi:hypothetical protein
VTARPRGQARESGVSAGSVCCDHVLTGAENALTIGSNDFLVVVGMVTGRGLAGDRSSGPQYRATCSCGFEKTSGTRYVECPAAADSPGSTHNFDCERVKPQKSSENG